MAAREENESEILLGNKQLLAVFAVVALLLAIAFTGGYMLGKGSAVKKVAAGEASNDAAASPLTKTVTPDDPPPAKADEPPDSKLSPAEARHEPVLGAPKEHIPSAAVEPVPKAGQTFVQVSALTHTQAEALAVVLRKQNFRARTALKPGTNLYRVLVGPVKDAGDLSSTRESLRKIGFHDMVVQHF